MGPQGHWLRGSRAGRDVVTILLLHGVTPTGVGIQQNSDGSLRPTTACCGALFTDIGLGPIHPQCEKCGKDYFVLRTAVFPKTLAKDVYVNLGSMDTLLSWLRTITGDPGATMEIS